MSDTDTVVSPAPTDVLTAFSWYADAVLSLPADAIESLADAYDSIRGRRRRRIADTAQRASDLAYDLGRIHVPDDADLPEGLTAEEYDTAAAGTVVGVPERLASVEALLKLDDVLGVVLIVGLAVLVNDQLAARDYEEVTGWWAAAGGPLPSTHTITLGPEQGSQPTPAARRRRVAPPAGATVPAPEPVARRERPARSRRTRVVKSGPVLLGFLVVLLIVGSFVSALLAFMHLAMGNGSEVWFVLTVAAGVGASVTAAIRQQAIIKQARR